MLSKKLLTAHAKAIAIAMEPEDVLHQETARIAITSTTCTQVFMIAQIVLLAIPVALPAEDPLTKIARNALMESSSTVMVHANLATRVA